MKQSKSQKARAHRLKVGNLTSIEINKGTRKRLKIFVAINGHKSMDEAINYLLSRQAERESSLGKNISNTSLDSPFLPKPKIWDEIKK